MNTPLPAPIRYAFFGTSRYAVIVLGELERAGLMPTIIVTTPDRPQGRGLRMMSTPVKEWALAKGIPVHSPEKLDADFAATLAHAACEVFVVVSYGKIIPQEIIDLPPHKTLNVHPSLLPLYRGPSPLQSAMLDDAKRTGITVMRLDKEMDHGPIVAQSQVAVNEWPTYADFEELMAHEGGRLLAETLPKWVTGALSEREQDHSQATYVKMIKKEDALLDLSANPYTNFRKIQAYREWPTAYFFADRGGNRVADTTGGASPKQIRVKVTRASFKDGKLTIERVIPEGSREMDYSDFLRG